MPRKPRIHFPGAVYHALARGVERRPIFVDDNDRRRFLDLMWRYERELGAKILAYCLMGNHFHLAIKVGASTLAAFMQRLSGSYGAGFNRRYDRVGHLFESRYKDNLCLDDRYLLTLIHYIHMNPVRAGLVSAPGDWPWSSFRPTDGPFPDLDGFEPWYPADQTSDLNRILDDVKSLDRLGEATFAQTGVTVDRLKSLERRDGITISARRKFVLEAAVNGHSLASAARWLKTSRSTVSRYAAPGSDPNNATAGGLTPFFLTPTTQQREV